MNLQKRESNPTHILDSLKFRNLSFGTVVLRTTNTEDFLCSLVEIEINGK